VVNTYKVRISKNNYMETEAVIELRKIRTDLDMLTNLYSKLVDRLIPEEEPEFEDFKAIKGRDEIASESKLLKVLNADTLLSEEERLIVSESFKHEKEGKLVSLSEFKKDLSS
jgi:hypothetical protein